MLKEESILSVKNLKTYFHLEEGILKAVDGISFDLQKGKTLAIVGESGSGKSVSAYSIIRLLQSPPAKIESGEIFFKGKDILSLSEKEMRKYRGSEIAMVFQEPMTALNPVFTIEDQISEVFKIHQKLNKKEARQKSIESLEMVGIPSPKERVKDYPHQLSGGMRQRVLIAMALACNPTLLIADEPTTALDVTIQAQILDLLKELKEKLEMTVLLITHDLGIVAQNADDVVVMYAGNILEKTSCVELFENPLHPYTKALKGSLLSSVKKEDLKDGRVPVIPGNVPDLLKMKDECRFADRCSLCTPECREVEPKLREISSGHYVRCIKV